MERPKGATQTALEKYSNCESLEQIQSLMTANLLIARIRGEFYIPIGKNREKESEIVRAWTQNIGIDKQALKKIVKGKENTGQVTIEEMYVLAVKESKVSYDALIESGEIEGETEADLTKDYAPLVIVPTGNLYGRGSFG